MPTCAKGFTREKIAKYVSEFIGTAWLVLIIKLSVPNFEYPSLTIGLGLCAIIYTYGYISKAHYNPSITVAFMIRDIPAWPRSDKIQIIMYFISEYLGGIFGGLLGWLIGGDNSGLVYPSTILNNSGNNITFIILFKSFIAEVIFTFILTSVILSVATDARQNKNQYYGISIGLCVTVGIMCIGKISGCCLNSAVWVGTVLPALFIDNKIDLSDAWIYWIAPFLGSIIAAILFNIVYGKYKVKNEEGKCISLTDFTELQNMKRGNQCFSTDV